MPLGPGAKLGPYEFLAPLGAGGMGEVYRARDPRLGRDVAIKLLPAEVASDNERLARFRREAHLLASLNHPHIAAVHGLEEWDGKLLLVLELVDGEDLAERLKRGAIPVDEALAIAKQVAEALEEAHEKGIVHRDLKPANIKLTPEGKAKVLDFGLAKAYAGEQAANSSGASDSPTLTQAGSQSGVILGTAAYMPPEQARGKPVDKRADIWAFGVVLFEMLTGKRLFRGETTSDTLAAVLKMDPDWSLLPAETPPRIRELLSRCLARDPRLRLRDIGEARVTLERVGSGSGGAERYARPAWKARLAVVALGLVAGALLVWSVAPRGQREAAVKPGPVSRLSIALPADAPFWLDYAPNCNLAISRDGRQVAYGTGKRIGGTGRRLYVRRLDDLTVRAVPETDGAFNPFFSPDGEWIAFFSLDGMLKKVSLAGGRPVVLARDLPNAAYTLGSWSDDGRIVFDTSNAGLRVVPAAGGIVTTLTTVSGEWHRDPQILPESDIVLYSVQAISKLQVEGVSLDGKKSKKPLLENASHARYLGSGHLLFMRDGGLMIAPFARDRMEITGPAASVPLEVAVDDPNQAATVPQLAVSLGGTLVYVPVAAGSLRSSTLVWVDRHGAIEEAGTLPFAVPVFCLSSDGSQIAVTGRDAGNARIDLYDLSRKAATRLMDRDVDYPTAPLFSVDGRRLLFGRWDTERSELWWQPVDGTGGPERILTMPGITLTPSSVSPDGRFVIFMVFDMTSGDDLWIADLEAKTEPRARRLLVTKDDESGAAFSPNGRFIAYNSSESGDINIYVRRFPEGDMKTPVSTDGGVGAQWSRDGTELYFQPPGGKKLIAVSVRRKDRALSFGEPHVLFEGPYLMSTNLGPSYAVSPDGRRFLMTRQPNFYPMRVSELVVVQDWFEDVRRLTGTAR